MIFRNAVQFPRKSKYRSVKTTVNGITFHSKKEAKKYGELKMLLLAEELVKLELQVPFKIIHNDILICTYFADFVTYDKKGVRHVLDSKGFQTPEYRLKKKLVKAFYGIEIEEC